MTRVSPHHPLRRWFAGLVESSFQTEIGLADAELLEYLTNLLTDFIHVERINVLGDGSGRRVEDVAEMLSEVRFGPASQSDEQRRQVHRHIGDFTLFWTGVYPENLRRQRRRAHRDGLLSYLEQGKRSYAIASELSDDRSRPPARLLQRLSDSFECCVYGLGIVRREWEHADPGGFSSARMIWT